MLRYRAGRIFTYQCSVNQAGENESSGNEGGHLCGVLSFLSASQWGLWWLPTDTYRFYTPTLYTTLYKVIMNRICEYALGTLPHRPDKWESRLTYFGRSIGEIQGLTIERYSIHTIDSICNQFNDRFNYTGCLNATWKSNELMNWWIDELMNWWKLTMGVFRLK